MRARLVWLHLRHFKYPRGTSQREVCARSGYFRTPVRD